MLQHPRDMRANNRPPLGLGKPATKSIKSSTRGIGKPRGRRTDDAIAEASAKKLRETLRQAEAKQTASWVRAQHQVCLHRGLLSNFLQHFFRENVRSDYHCPETAFEVQHRVSPGKCRCRRGVLSGSVHALRLQNLFGFLFSFLFSERRM